MLTAPRGAAPSQERILTARGPTPESKQAFFHRRLGCSRIFSKMLGCSDRDWNGAANNRSHPPSGAGWDLLFSTLPILPCGKS